MRMTECANRIVCLCNRALRTFPFCDGADCHAIGVPGQVSVVDAA